MRIEDIQEQFPAPVEEKKRKESAGAYCVGGALCLFMGRPTRFPNVQDLTEVLVECYHKDPTISTTAATLIVLLNDDGKFEAAWQAAATDDMAELYALARDNDLLDEVPTIWEWFLSTK